LVELLIGEKPPVGEIPKVSMLPGTCASLVARQMNKIGPIYKPNKQWLRCLYCNHAAVYDIGMTVFNARGWS